MWPRKTIYYPWVNTYKRVLDGVVPIKPHSSSILAYWPHAYDYEINQSIRLKIVYTVYLTEKPVGNVSESAWKNLQLKSLIFLYWFNVKNKMIITYKQLRLQMAVFSWWKQHGKMTLVMTTLLYSSFIRCRTSWVPCLFSTSTCVVLTGQILFWYSYVRWQQWR